MDAIELGRIFHALHETGLPVNAIAREAGVKPVLVLRLIKAARHDRRRLPRHLPRIWIVLHPDERPCDHHEAPIPRGEPEYCCSCSRSGYDGHPKLLIQPRRKGRAKSKSLAQRRWGTKADA